MDGNKLGLASYYFDTSIIPANAEVQDMAQVYALVSPSINRLEKTTLRTDQRPKFIISRDRDRRIQSPRLPPVLESLAKPFRCQIVAGADHYWVGREEEFAQQVSRFFSKHLK